jgi:hypothetical protein
MNTWETEVQGRTLSEIKKTARAAIGHFFEDDGEVAYTLDVSSAGEFTIRHHDGPVTTVTPYFTARVRVIW